MIWRSDDIWHGCDVQKLKDMDYLFDKHGIKEVLALVMYEKGEPFNEDNDLMKCLREKIERGNEIALHGYDHKDITSLSTRDALFELIQAKKQIEDLLEVKIRYYVPPYHIISPELTMYLKVIGLEVLAGNGADLVPLVNTYETTPTEMFWFHWWEMNIKKLEQWLIKYKEIG